MKPPTETKLEQGIRDQISEERYQQTLNDCELLLECKPPVNRSYATQSTIRVLTLENSKVPKKLVQTASSYGFHPLAKIESTICFDSPYNSIFPDMMHRSELWVRPDGLQLHFDSEHSWCISVVFDNAFEAVITDTITPGSEFPNRAEIPSAGDFEEDLDFADTIPGQWDDMRPLLVVDLRTLELVREIGAYYLSFDLTKAIDRDSFGLIKWVEPNRWRSGMRWVAFLTLLSLLAFYVQSWIVLGTGLVLSAIGKVAFNAYIQRWIQHGKRMKASSDLPDPEAQEANDL